LARCAGIAQGNLKDWTTVSGTWNLIQENGKTYLHSSPAVGPARIIVGKSEWTDYSVEVTAQIDQWLSSNLPKLHSGRLGNDDCGAASGC
jgi:hypothetical protein